MNQADHVSSMTAPEDWRTYTLTQADLVEGTATQFIANLRRRRFLVFGGVIAALLMISGYLSNGTTGLWQSASGIVWFVIAFPLLMIRVIIPRQIRAAMKTQPALKASWRIAVAADALHLQNAAGDVRYRWDGFVGWRANRTVLLLSTAPTTAFPIPLRALEPGERERIEANLRAAGVEPGGPSHPGR